MSDQWPWLLLKLGFTPPAQFHHIGCRVRNRRHLLGSLTGCMDAPGPSAETKPDWRSCVAASTHTGRMSRNKDLDLCWPWTEVPVIERIVSRLERTESPDLWLTSVKRLYT
jgi:hypothetical protein